MVFGLFCAKLNLCFARDTKKKNILLEGYVFGCFCRLGLLSFSLVSMSVLI